MGSQTNVDTSMFRRAVWNYIQCIYGIRHDDYDYREVNELLDRDLKEYIKAVCCYPDRMTKEDYDNVMREFKYSEKVRASFPQLAGVALTWRSFFSSRHQAFFLSHMKAQFHNIPCWS